MEAGATDLSIESGSRAKLESSEPARLTANLTPENDRAKILIQGSMWQMRNDRAAERCDRCPPGTNHLSGEVFKTSAPPWFLNIENTGLTADGSLLMTPELNR